MTDREGQQQPVPAAHEPPVSAQLVVEELPGARKRIPLRALWLSLAALGVAVYGALSSPEFLAGYDSLSWLLVLIPAFLLAYYRGWVATTRVIAGGTLLVLVIELVAEHVFGVSVDWVFLFWIAVVLLAVGLGLALVSELLQRERRRALVLAYSDPLTGLPNRRLLDFMLEKEFAAARRGRPLSVVLFDVDGFGAYNDRYGHLAGDFALKGIGATLDRHMRMMNIGGRYDGDSFLAILSGEKVDGAWVFAERTRQAVADLALDPGMGPTVSVGVASYELWMRESSELLDAASRALATARAAGGNRVICETIDEDERQLPRDLTALPPEMQAAFEHAWRRQAVEDAEVRFRKLFDGVPVGLYRARPDGQVLDVNSSLVRMFRYPDRESLIAVSAENLYVDPADRARWKEQLRREGVVYDFEARFRRYDGTVMWGRDTARAVMGRDGVVRYYTGALEDITERKQAEEDLRAANEKLRAVFDAAPVALVSLDPEGRVTSWNRAACDIFGWTVEEVIGQPPPFVPDDARDEFRGLFERVRRGESLMGVEVRRRRRDGTAVDLNLYAAPLFAADGQVAGIMGMVVDVTERRELEARLVQAQKMESIGRLAGGVAHDFNNLLTVILGNLEIVMADTPADSPQRPELEDIRSAAKHATALTRQLLAFSRRQALQPRVLSLNTTVTEMLEMLGRIIGEDVELVTDLDTSLGSTMADPVEIGQVLMNLAINARDAMPGGGRLAIRTRNVELDRDRTGLTETIPTGRYVALSVSDTGVGMDGDTMSRIFEPFFTTKAKGQGTGLGLSTVFGIVKQSGGYIQVESERGRGTTFTVYLPRHEGRGEPARRRRPVTAGRATGTVLIVEDEGALRAPMRRGLERAGFTVLEARNADEALAVCREHEGEIQAMVTDVVMPGMDGLELGRRVAELRPEMRVLYTSGYAQGVVSRDEGTGPEDFLQKPYTPSELVKAIRALLA